MASNQQLSRVQQDRLELLARVGLKMAGFKPAHLRKAHKRELEALDAEIVKVSHNRDGEEVRRLVLPDHNTRLVAARAIKQMIPGMYPSQGAGMERADGMSLHVQIILQQQDGSQQIVEVSGHPSRSAERPDHDALPDGQTVTHTPQDS